MLNYQHQNTYIVTVNNYLRKRDENDMKNKGEKLNLFTQDPSSPSQ